MKESAVHIYLKNPQGEPKNIGIFYFTEAEMERLAADWEAYLTGDKKGGVYTCAEVTPITNNHTPKRLMLRFDDIALLA